MVKKRVGRDRVNLNEALEELYSLLVMNWTLATNNFVIVDEYAYVLQGYDVQGPEVETGHIDVYVDPSRFPWPDKGERSIIPPKDSSYMDQWENFMEETGYGLDLLRASPEILVVPVVEHVLPSGNMVRLMRAFEMTNLFVQQTIMRYSLEDVGEEKVREWMGKLSLIRDAAIKRADEKLVELCKIKLEESRIKWKQIF